MSDKENKNEFVFEDENENHTQEYTESSYAGSTENIKTIFKNKRIITLAGGVVVVWLLSFVLESVFGSNDKIVEKATSNVDIEQATSELTSADEATESDEKPAEDDSTSAVAEEPAPAVNKDVQDHLDNNTAAVKAIQDNAEVHKMQLNQLASQIAEVAQQVSAVSASNHDLAQRIAAIEAKAKAKEEAAKKVVQPKLEDYHIKALIDGRAWLVGPNKEYVTVVVGDKLKDYGTIVGIYSEKGLVSTSSGRVIHFASN